MKIPVSLRDVSFRPATPPVTGCFPVLLPTVRPLLQIKSESCSLTRSPSLFVQPVYLFMAGDAIGPLRVGGLLWLRAQPDGAQCSQGPEEVVEKLPQSSQGLVCRSATSVLPNLVRPQAIRHHWEVNGMKWAERKVKVFVGATWVNMY